MRSIFVSTTLPFLLLSFASAQKQPCTLCFNGSDPTPGVDTLPEAMKDQGYTCEGINAFDISPFKASDSVCRSQRGNALFCGCPKPEMSSDNKNLCSLCEDGSPIPADKAGRVITSDKKTCADIATIVTFFGGIDQCSRTQATTGVYCGCKNPVASKGMCRVCGGNNLLPDPSKVVLSIKDNSTGQTTTTTCLDVEYNQPGESCDVLQSVYNKTCGCSGSYIMLPMSEVVAVALVSVLLLVV